MKNRAMDRAWFGAYSAAVLTVAMGTAFAAKPPCRCSRSSNFAESD
ncbi:MAG: hypothetical protein IJL17_10520 [Kiritimatiellae bacterium]|nr:hypothetical protein [Kiritimatiellia bacterium]